jgi:hypothetical protein
VGNNPVNFNDPDGLAARAIGNAATQTVSYFASGGMADLFPQGAPIVTTGQAFGALAAYAQGVATGNSSLVGVAVQGMAANKQNNIDALVMFGTMGRGGAKTDVVNIPSASTKVIQAPETIAPRPIKPENAVSEWEKFLGPGPYTNQHPRTGATDPDRIVSSDGARSIRYGSHEMNSGPTKQHYHQETWSYDPVADTMTVTNTIVRIPKQ